MTMASLDGPSISQCPRSLVPPQRDCGLTGGQVVVMTKGSLDRPSISQCPRSLVPHSGTGLTGGQAVVMTKASRDGGEDRSVSRFPSTPTAGLWTDRCCC